MKYKEIKEKIKEKMNSCVQKFRKKRHDSIIKAYKNKGPFDKELFVLPLLSIALYLSGNLNGFENFLFTFFLYYVASILLSFFLEAIVRYLFIEVYECDKKCVLRRIIEKVYIGLFWIMEVVIMPFKIAACLINLIVRFKAKKTESLRDFWKIAYVSAVIVYIIYSVTRYIGVDHFCKMISNALIPWNLQAVEKTLKYFGTSQDINLKNAVLSAETIYYFVYVSVIILVTTLVNFVGRQIVKSNALKTLERQVKNSESYEKQRCSADEDLKVFFDKIKADKEKYIAEETKNINYEDCYLKSTLVRPQLIFLLFLFGAAIFLPNSVFHGAELANVVSLFSLFILYLDKRNGENIDLDE